MDLYPEYSNFVEGVDTAFIIIIGISLFFLVGLSITTLVFLYKYNNKRHPKPKQMKDNYSLEITWTLIPLLIVLGMFYYGYIAFYPMREAPEDSYIIKAEGRMWRFEFFYPSGKSSQDLYMPVDTPVKLIMTSPDVLHSLYIPAFRVKEDMVPGKETEMWFRANYTDTFEILCAEYCGLRHSYMISDAIVMPQDSFFVWVENLETKDKEEHPGLEILRNNACLGCHSLDGSKLVGASFKGLFNQMKKVKENGEVKEIVVDEEYIKSSIYEPNKQIVEGYAPNLMQSYKDVVTPLETDTIIEFLKTL